MKKVIVVALIYLIGLGCFLALCERTDNLDAKKELSNTPVQNVNR